MNPCAAVGDPPPTGSTVLIDASGLANASREVVTSDDHLTVRGPRGARVADVVVYRSRDGRLTVDAAEYDRVELKLADWPVDEFMYFLSGRVEIGADIGGSQIYGAGDGIVMPRGFDGNWKQHTDIRKLAVSYSPVETPAGGSVAGALRSHGPGIVKVTAASLAGAEQGMQPLANWEPYLTIKEHPGARYFESSVFRSQDGHLTVNVKRFEPVVLRLSDWPLDEVMHIFRGQVEVRGDSGDRHVYKATETFVLPRGFAGTWIQRQTVDMLTVEYDSSHKH